MKVRQTVVSPDVAVILGRAAPPLGTQVDGPPPGVRAQEGQAPPEGLVHFKLEGNTLDSSGNGNNATVTGSPTAAGG